MMRKFVIPAEFKDAGHGSFTGYGNVTGIVDLGGDRVMPGAFKQDLLARGPIRPLLWSHDPAEPIGTVALGEDSYGLRVNPGQLVLAVQRAAEAYALLKQPGAIGGMSIGYEIKSDRIVNGIREILALDVWEVSLTCFPMNPRSIVDSVKDAEVDGGLRRLAASIRAARDEMRVQQVLSTLRELNLAFRTSLSPR